MKTAFVCILFLSAMINSFAQDKIKWKKVTVLVYTKNGNGYVHENIPASVKCIQQFGKQYGFKVDTSGNPSVMTEDNLKRYTMLIFPSTNNDVFENNAQRLAFRHYIEAGGGFVGIHSVTGTERNWKWFKNMLGGTFAWHANFQRFSVKMILPAHASMQGLPKVWEKEDECYFSKQLFPGPKVLMAHDLSSLNTSDTVQRNLITKHAGGFTELYPAVWTHDFDGGHTWVTALGHDKKDYSEPVYMQHLLQGIRYIAGTVKPLNFKKAYAGAFDEEVRY